MGGQSRDGTHVGEDERTNGKGCVRNGRLSAKAARAGAAARRTLWRMRTLIRGSDRREQALHRRRAAPDCVYMFYTAALTPPTVQGSTAYTRSPRPHCLSLRPRN